MAEEKDTAAPEVAQKTDRELIEILAHRVAYLERVLQHHGLIQNTPSQYKQMDPRRTETGQGAFLSSNSDFL